MSVRFIDQRVDFCVVAFDEAATVSTGVAESIDTRCAQREVRENLVCTLACQESSHLLAGLESHSTHLRLLRAIGCVGQRFGRLTVEEDRLAVCQLATAKPNPA